MFIIEKYLADNKREFAELGSQLKLQSKKKKKTENYCIMYFVKSEV